MRIFFLLLTILFFSNCKTSQKSFTGLIKFSTKVSSANSVSEEFKKNLTSKFGDSLLMQYEENGDFTRKQLNIKNEYSIQYFNAKKGKIFLKGEKNSIIIDSLDTTFNRLSRKSKRKVENQIIMDLDCKCYEYIATTNPENQNVTLTFCFSNKTPYLDYKLYDKHKEFFLSDFFKTSERPYLKFSLKTKDYELIYTATDIMIK